MNLHKNGFLQTIYTENYNIALNVTIYIMRFYKLSNLRTVLWTIYIKIATEWFYKDNSCNEFIVRIYSA